MLDGDAMCCPRSHWLDCEGKTVGLHCHCHQVWSWRACLSISCIQWITPILLDWLHFCSSPSLFSLCRYLAIPESKEDDPLYGLMQMMACEVLEILFFQKGSDWKKMTFTNMLLCSLVELLDFRETLKPLVSHLATPYEFMDLKCLKWSIASCDSWKDCELFYSCCFITTFSYFSKNDCTLRSWICFDLSFSSQSGRMKNVLQEATEALKLLEEEEGEENAKESASDKVPEWDRTKLDGLAAWGVDSFCLDWNREFSVPFGRLLLFFFLISIVWFEFRYLFVCCDLVSLLTC